MTNGYSWVAPDYGSSSGEGSSFDYNFDDSSSEEESSSEELDQDLHELYAEGLVGHAQPERELTGGIHVFHDLVYALAMTFDGWPDEVGAFDNFRQRAEGLLIRRKTERMQPESFGVLLKANPDVQKRFDAFLQHSELFKPFKNKHQYHAGLLKIMARGVKYVTEAKRTKYLIDLGPPLRRGGNIFDTAELIDRKGLTSIGGSFAGGRTAFTTKKKRCMWVMTGDQNTGYKFYSHVGKLARFHHSSFNAGDSVIAAGEWFVDKGSVTLINGVSGHYQPNVERFLRALTYLSNNGAVTNHTEVQVFEQDTRDEDRLPALDFLANHARYLMHRYQLYR